MAGLAAGLALGAIWDAVAWPALARAIEAADMVGGLWLDALKMTIVPLVFALIVSGVMSSANAAASGRITARSIVLFAILLPAGAAVAAIALRDGEEKPAFTGSQPPPGIGLPDFKLPDNEGREVSSAALRGKVVLVTFLDTQCDESCPIIASQIGRATDRLGAEERPDVVAVAIST
ncbi:MAG: cation:dicarboxylate symporter family transporter, partial [Myxococcota bacterium]